MSVDLLSEVEACRTLEGVMGWALPLMPAAEIAGGVTQYEFTHDNILTAAEVLLVFDTT